jgi:Tol biopolymer transport system component
MRLKIFTSLSILLLVSCAPKEAPGSTMAPPEATETPSATAAPPAATSTLETETSTSMPVVEITKQTISEVDQFEPGTYLVYPKELEDGYALTFIKSDASKKVTRAFPLIFEYYSVEASIIQGVSPDGKYYAYLSGFVGEPMSDYDLEGDYDLQLNVVSLQDESVLAEIPLLSDSFPANFLEYAENHQDEFESEYGRPTVELVAQGLFTAFQTGIGEFQWSPNSRYLAFAGEMDGPSSDLYVFDAANLSVRRLTSGPEQIQRITWSPDSQQIAHASTNEIAAGSAYTNHIASLDGSRVISFPDYRIRRGFWLTNDHYLAFNVATGAGSNHLILYDTIEGSARVIWPYQFSNCYFLTSRDSLLVNYPEFSILDAGIYLVDPATTKYTQILTGEFWAIRALEREDYLLVFVRMDDGTYLVSNDFMSEKISDKSGWISVSPNNELIAISGDKDDGGLDIYSLGDQTTITIIDNEFYGVDWLPDSSGFFLEIGDSLCVHDLINGSTIEVDDSINYFGFPPYSKFVEIE